MILLQDWLPPSCEELKSSMFGLIVDKGKLISRHCLVEANVRLLQGQSVVPTTLFTALFGGKDYLSCPEIYWSKFGNFLYDSSGIICKDLYLIRGQERGPQQGYGKGQYITQVFSQTIMVSYGISRTALILKYFLLKFGCVKFLVARVVGLVRAPDKQGFSHPK